VDREDATKSGVGGGHASKGNDCDSNNVEEEEDESV